MAWPYFSRLRTRLIILVLPAAIPVCSSWMESRVRPFLPNSDFAQGISYMEGGERDLRN
jgi:hypothetical protein